jgi:hypothetical protein
MVSMKSKYQGRGGEFMGKYETHNDPLMSPRERVQMTAEEVRAATGYRFT